MRNVILCLLISLALVACGHKEEPAKKLGLIEELQKEELRLEKLLAEINPDEVITIISTITADMDSALKVCQQSKTLLSPEDGTFFGRYQALRTGVKKFDTRLEQVKKELAVSKTQLANLKAASDSDKLDEEAIKKYTISEKIALEKLTQAIEQLHASAVYVSAGYAEYRPQFLEKLSEISKNKK